MLTQLHTLYTDYAEKTKEVRKKARVFDGILGLGKDPRNHPCHEGYFEAVGAWVTEFLAAEPAQEELMQVAAYLLEEPLVYAGQECYWFMYAAHGHIKPIVPYLSKENCRELAQRLEKSYKKLDRMPLQKELLKMLNKAAR